ncbi:hypothetical protein [Iningainema tapete]|uniref:Uncharacterized protein n=1 Tax=Iningainema tapete BLCC-T55 TaxID=2748662 RepID=A0A8J6XD75_9CYAN|nr:hypothetical protein [Iningainema tapete]MBD2770965.1 hypothetical protein [Iningainema tapete BLCC-T55]
MSHHESKLYQAATELGSVLERDEEFLIQIDEIIDPINRKPTIDIADKLEQTKQQLLTEQGNVKTNLRIVVELLEKVMVLQSLNEKSTYSTAETLRHFQGKLDKQKWDDPSPPNIALYLFWQVWAAIAYSAITIGVLLIAYVPAANYCQRRESPFCAGIHNMRTYVVGESKPTNLK